MTVWDSWPIRKLCKCPFIQIQPQHPCSSPAPSFPAAPRFAFSPASSNLQPAGRVPSASIKEVIQSGIAPCLPCDCSIFQDSSKGSIFWAESAFIMQHLHQLQYGDKGILFSTLSLPKDGAWELLVDCPRDARRRFQWGRNEHAAVTKSILSSM